MNKNKGFTLIEIAIVLAIAGILLSVVLLKSDFLIGGAKTTDTIVLIKDLSTAIRDFKTQYHYLPGDMPTAGEELSGISVACNIAIVAGNKIGDGQINTATEIACVPEHLVLAGLIKGSASGIFTLNNSSSEPDVFVTAKRTTGTLPPAFPVTVINEIQLTNQWCDTAKTIDLKLDDGDRSTGRIRASVTTCTSDERVGILDIAL